MMFIFKIAEQLGQTIHWVMNNVTSLEMEAWVKYYDYLHKQQTKQRKVIHMATNHNIYNYR